MTKIPEIVKTSWNHRKGPIVFATVDQNGNANVIYATCVTMYDDQTVVIANNYFSKTIQNIHSGSRGSVLFISEDGYAIQLKGSITYYQDGPIFDDMKKWNPEKHPGLGAAALNIEEIYNGAEKLL